MAATRAAATYKYVPVVYVAAALVAAKILGKQDGIYKLGKKLKLGNQAPRTIQCWVYPIFYR